MEYSSSFSDSSSESEDETSNLSFDGGSKEGRERTEVAAVEGLDRGDETLDEFEKDEEREDMGLGAVESAGVIELAAGLRNGLTRPEGLLAFSAPEGG